MSKKKNKKLRKNEKIKQMEEHLRYDSNEKISQMHRSIAFTEQVRRKAMDAFDDWVRGLEMRFGSKAWEELASVDVALLAFARFLLDVGEAKQEREGTREKPSGKKWDVSWKAGNDVGLERIEAPTKQHAEKLFWRQVTDPAEGLHITQIDEVEGEQEGPGEEAETPTGAKVEIEAEGS